MAHKQLKTSTKLLMFSYACSSPVIYTDACSVLNISDVQSHLLTLVPIICPTIIPASQEDPFQ